MNDVGETTPRIDGWVDMCRYSDRNAENRVGGGDSEVAAGCWWWCADSEGTEDVEGACLVVGVVPGGGAGCGKSSRNASGVMHMRSRNG